MVQIEADPYPWPYDGPMALRNTALLCIDWQGDFCSEGGWIDQRGHDISDMRDALQMAATVLRAAREAGMPVIHTREGHKPDLSDVPPNKMWRSANTMGAAIGSEGPLGRIMIRGEPGWEIVPEIAPIEGETVIDKPGKGSFYSTDLELILRNKGITHLVVNGITTETCVQTTIREANDRGFECLLLSDCTASLDRGLHKASLLNISIGGGIFGCVSNSEKFLDALASTDALREASL